MFKTRSTATATKRRGVIIAAAAGALALGAMAPASAATATAKSIAPGEPHGRVIICGHTGPGVPAEPGTPVVVGKATKPVKREVAKRIELAKPGTGKGKVITCPAIPGKPVPGKVCKVIVIKKGDRAHSSVPAIPAKPTLPGKPGKPAKPGKCVIIVAKGGKHVAQRGSTAAGSAVAEAAPATRP